MLFLYLSLCVIRFLCAALLPGYIHPDEFFQGPEVLAGMDDAYSNCEKSYRYLLKQCRFAKQEMYLT